MQTEPTPLPTSAPAPTTSKRIESDAIYSVKTASDLLEIHEVTLRKKLRAGVVRGSRRLGDWRMRGADLLSLV